MSDTLQHPKESGHWYSSDGKWIETVTGKNGKERAPTLRDARIYGYVPGATTILKVAARPGLEKWKRDQILMSALTLPKIKNEPLDNFAERIQQDANEQSKKAREKGTAIHAAIQEYFQKDKDECWDEWIEKYNNYNKETEATVKLIDFDIGGQDWKVEQTFSSPLGYGGKVDLYSDDVIIDFKTKEFDETADVKKMAYDTNGMQLAAYKRGVWPSFGKGLYDCDKHKEEFNNIKLVNIFISTKVPGLVLMYEWENPERLWKMFRSLLDYYKLKNNFMEV